LYVATTLDHSSDIPLGADLNGVLDLLCLAVVPFSEVGLMMLELCAKMGISLRKGLFRRLLTVVL